MTAACLATLLTGCATNDESRINFAGASKADASIGVQALEILNNIKEPQIPKLPSDCSQREKSGVKVKDRQDVALLKTDRALGKANDRVIRCSSWYTALYPKL